MKISLHFNLRRALAMLLALALFAALPALAEDVAVELDNSPELAASDEEALSDGLSIDALPELSDDLELSDDIDLALSDDIEPVPTEGEVDNTSKPIPTHQALSYTLKLSRNVELDMDIQDDLTISGKTSDIDSWTLSTDKVVKVTRNPGSNNLYVEPIAEGSVRIKVTLVSGKTYVVSLRIKDALKLRDMGFTQEKVSLAVGQDIDLMQFFARKPDYARANLTFKAADPSIVSIKKTLLTGMKPGKTNLIVTDSISGKKDNMTLVVVANRTPDLHDKPTTKDVNKLAKKWTLWPKALELNNDFTITCELYLLNDFAGKLTARKNLDLTISARDDTGNNLVARSTFKSVKVDCAENKWKTITVTFPAKAVYCPNVSLTRLNAKNLIFQLNKVPGAAAGKDEGIYYEPTVITYAKPAKYDNPVKYRALLVAETAFYHPEAKNASKRWERVRQNSNDVKLMKNMLEQVKTPEGGKYSIKTKINTTRDELRQAIQSAFAGADTNDVSLFFFSSHGVSSDEASDSLAGALSMGSKEEKEPELMRLSELRDLLLAVPGKVIVILQTCGSGAAVKSNGKNSAEQLADAAAGFNAQVVDVFRSADPGVMEPGYAANTGELVKANKFYVLTAARYREEAFGDDDKNWFVYWLTQGVGKSGSMPADTKYSGNSNGMVDLHELYRYISGIGDWTYIKYEGKFYIQHVQVYPSYLRYPLFK